jgi:hypothetical protein
MKQKDIIFLFFITCFTNFIFAQENIEQNGNMENNNSLENTEKSNIDTRAEDKQQSIGLTFSFSGFNEFRLGLGVFFGNLGNDGGHHPLGDDFGLLFEYNFKENINYTRFYYHFTGGVGAILLGGSMVIAYDNNNMSIGFSPEIGFGLSTLFKIFYRYNFYINNKFNRYEIVFHLCLSRRN